MLFLLYTETAFQNNNYCFVNDIFVHGHYRMFIILSPSDATDLSRMYVLYVRNVHMYQYIYIIHNKEDKCIIHIRESLKIA